MPYFAAIQIYNSATDAFDLMPQMLAVPRSAHVVIPLYTFPTNVC